MTDAKPARTMTTQFGGDPSLLIDCAQFLDAMKPELVASNSWSDYDQKLRERITAALSRPETAGAADTVREKTIEECATALAVCDHVDDGDGYQWIKARDAYAAIRALKTTPAPPEGGVERPA